MAAKPFTFTPTDFKDGSAGGTPITAAELNKINTGISQLYEALPHYVVAASTDTPPSTPSILIVVNAGAYGGTYYADGTSVTQIHRPVKPPIALTTDTAFGLTFWSNGVTANANVSYTGGDTIQPWASLPAGYVIPVDYRPPVNLFTPAATFGTPMPQLYLVVNQKTGQISINNQSNGAVTLNPQLNVGGFVSWGI